MRAQFTVGKSARYIRRCVAATTTTSMALTAAAATATTLRNARGQRVSVLGGRTRAFFSLLSLYGSASECCNIESTVITHRLIDIFLFNANSTLLKVRRHESGVPEWRGTKNRMTLFTQFFIGLIFECRKVRLTHHRLSTKMKSMARAQNQLHLLISEKKMATF